MDAGTAVGCTWNRILQGDSLTGFEVWTTPALLKTSWGAEQTLVSQGLYGSMVPSGMYLLHYFQRRI